MDPTIQQVPVSASLAMLDRSDHSSDIESDIHNKSINTYLNAQSTNEQLSLNLNQSLSVKPNIHDGTTTSWQSQHPQLSRQWAIKKPH